MLVFPVLWGHTTWGGAVLGGMGWCTARRVCTSGITEDCETRQETRLYLQVFIPVYAALSTLAKVLFKSFCSECLCRRRYIELSPMPNVHGAINYHSITITSWIILLVFMIATLNDLSFPLLFSNCITPHCWILLSSSVSFSLSFLHMF